MKPDRFRILIAALAPPAALEHGQTESERRLLWADNLIATSSMQPAKPTQPPREEYVTGPNQIPLGPIPEGYEDRWWRGFRGQQNGWELRPNHTVMYAHLCHTKALFVPDGTKLTKPAK